MVSPAPPVLKNSKAVPTVPVMVVAEPSNVPSVGSTGELRHLRFARENCRC